MIEKRYDIKIIEKKRVEYMSSPNYLSKRNKMNRNGEAFCTTMPPPNVTGALHMGHALNCSIQDVLVRFAHMNGKNVRWTPGLDHAGIATQILVEHELKEKGSDKQDLGRAAFCEKVWEWKEKYGNKIIEQQKKLGFAVNWDKLKFTLDDDVNKAVLRVFVELYNQGLIYRDNRLVNWDHVLQTALSDLETEHQEVEGNYYHIKYYLKDSDKYLVVATSRPETLFGDMAVAVNPTDERYSHLVGKSVILPLVNKKIPIIADEYADPEKGTGVVKITPAHDFNDFEVGKRHSLELLNIMDKAGKLNNNVPQKYIGLDRFEVRKVIVKDLGEHLEKIVAINHQVLFGDRTGAVLEPKLTKQWFVDAKKLAAPAIEAVNNNKISFIPKFWEATYFQWLNNIQPWCISRQLWWGHQIPVWYGPDGKVFVAENENEAKNQAFLHYQQENVTLNRDPDVLDTWFSSALWTFSTLGWPDNISELNKYYPNNILVTGFDIIFFWVARMIMMGIHFIGEIPFKQVLINPLVKGKFGKKMSKSKANVIDPLVMTEKYGADALRISLLAGASPSTDMNFDENVIEGYRNFTTKIWNAARFLAGNIIIHFDDKVSIHEGIALCEEFIPDAATNPLNIWIISKIRSIEADIEKHIKNNRLDLATKSLYQFVWDDFCDWYIEFSKPLLHDEKYSSETISVATLVFKEIILILHPFMPFITDELYNTLFFGDKDAKETLLNLNWPGVNQNGTKKKRLVHKQLLEDVSNMISLIEKIRSVKTILQIGELEVILNSKGSLASTINSSLHIISNMIKAKNFYTIYEKPLDNITKRLISVEQASTTMTIILPEDIDLNSGKFKLQNKKDKLQKELTPLVAQANNGEFISKAPKKIVNNLRLHIEELEMKIKQHNSILKILEK